MTCHEFPSFLLDAPPHRLWSHLVVQTEKAEEVSSPVPRITIPVLILPSKDLEAGTDIPAMMMRFERARANPLLIQSHITTNDREDVLCLTPLPNAPIPPMACR